MTSRQPDILPPHAKSNPSGVLVMVRCVYERMLPPRTRLFYPSLREMPLRIGASVGGRVKASFPTAPSPHPEFAARFPTSPNLPFVDRRAKKGGKVEKAAFSLFEPKQNDDSAIYSPSLTYPLKSAGRGRMTGSGVHSIPICGNKCGVTSGNGFTLIEIAIVLVVIGLLLGGLLIGQSLISAAKLRAVSTEYNQYVTATYSFYAKYKALPGDMTNAQNFWGVAHATPATCVTTASIGTETCNGNGDNIINALTGSGSNEKFRYWQHLANAGLIEGKYNGIACITNDGCTDPTNSPSSRFKSNALWHITTLGIIGDDDITFFAGDYTKMYMLGGESLVYSWPNVRIFRPEEAWIIDTKIDDGRPATGIFVPRWNDPSCVTATSGADVNANYNLTSSTGLCLAHFRGMF